MTIDHTNTIDSLLVQYEEALGGVIAYAMAKPDEVETSEPARNLEAIRTELRRRDAELAAFKTVPTPWHRLPYAEKQRREAAMHRVAGAAGHGASVTTDFPWQGRVSISGSWDIEDLRKLLAAMEGR